MKFQPNFEADKGTGGSAETPGNAASAGADEAKTYTQAELDKLFADRAKQASSSERSKILDALGAKDLEEAKTLLKKQKETEQAQMSEAEKLKAQLTEHQKQLESMKLAQRTSVTQYEIKLQAQKLGIGDPEDAYRLLDLDRLEYDETGRPTNVEAELRKLITRKPYLLSGSGAGSSATNASIGKSSQTFTNAQVRDPVFFNANREAITLAIREGRIKD